MNTYVMIVIFYSCILYSKQNNKNEIKEIKSPKNVNFTCISHTSEREKKFKIMFFFALVFKSNSDLCNTCIYKFLKVVFIYIKEST